MWDFNLGIGGPIAKDRLWYALNLREEGRGTVPGMFANANAGVRSGRMSPTRAARRARRLLSHHRAQAHRAGHAAKQVHGVLRPATPLRRRCRAWILWRRLQIERRRGLRRVHGAPDPSASAIAAPETAGMHAIMATASQVKWTPVEQSATAGSGDRHVAATAAGSFPAETEI